MSFLVVQESIMTEIIIKLIEQLNSSVFILLVILIAFFVAVSRISMWFGEWKADNKHHEDRLSKIENIHETVVALKERVQMIYENTNPRAMTRSNSPVAITDKGHEVAEKVGARDIFDKYKHELIEEVEKAKPNNAYDIQTESFNVVKQYMVKRLSEEELRTLKDEAFYQGVILEDIMTIFGVYLRDAVLGLKGIPVSDVDLYDKNKRS